jgi:hypothetical protein
MRRRTRLVGCDAFIELPAGFQSPAKLKPKTVKRPLPRQAIVQRLNGAFWAAKAISAPGSPEI